MDWLISVSIVNSRVIYTVAYISFYFYGQHLHTHTRTHMVVFHSLQLCAPRGNMLELSILLIHTLAILFWIFRNHRVAPCLNEPHSCMFLPMAFTRLHPSLPRQSLLFLPSISRRDGYDTVIVPCGSDFISYNVWYWASFCRIVDHFSLKSCLFKGKTQSDLGCFLC